MKMLNFVHRRVVGSNLLATAPVLLSSALLLQSPGAAANHLAGERYAMDNSFYAYARVTDVDPIYETVEHQVPRETCWTEKVRYTPHQRHHNRHHGDKSATPVIIGALIGGALGNELGHHKRNKQVGAVAGAILGGSIGADIQRQNRHDRYHDSHYDSAYDVAYRDEQRCKTYYDVETEERLTGYEVSYRFSGREYQTITDQHPGKKLRVRVGVEPAE